MTQQSIADFRTYLQAELVRRCKKNPKYSLRAFASQLGISASYLSHLLGGRRGVKRATVQKLAARLGMSPAAASAFLASEAQAGLTSGVVLQSLGEEEFRLISDWYHYAILEIGLCEDHSRTAKEIAYSLGISYAEAQSALQRLNRLKLIQVDSHGRWIGAPQECTTTQNAFTSSAFKNLQRGILEGAIHALEEVPIEERDQTSLTVALDPRLLPEIRSKIKKLRQEILALQKLPNKKSQVYQISLSAYPVLKKQKSKRSLS